MTNMVEIVARALAHEDLGSDVDVSRCADEESDPEWTFYTVKALTAIKAMREPTPEMFVGVLDNYRAWALLWWHKMIDAALEEQSL